MKPEQAGRTFPCPACHKPVTVPAAAGDATIDSDSADERDERVARSEHGRDGRGDAEQAPAPRPSHPAQGVPPRPSPSLQSPIPSPSQRFVVVDEIGRGGMGAVVRANDCEIRREVAVKYLLDQRDPQKKARFIEEAQITGQLEHPNIVPVHELGLDAEGKLYFTMKMVRGRSLKEVLDELRTAHPEHGRRVARSEHGRDGRGGDAKPRPSHPAQSVPPDEWSLSRLLGALVNVCHALAYAHSRGVVHRDLKPANIMVGDFGEVYVMDWGLAKVLPSAVRESDPHVGPERVGPEDVTISPSTTQQAGEHDSVTNSGSGSSAGAVSTDRGADSTALTMDGSILGTPVYMPPEQAAGDIKAIDQRSDVYSLGAILYELLTLQPPVDKSGGHMAVLKRVVQGEIKRPDQREPKRARAGLIPKELAAVAMKALAMKPADRYQSVEALRRDIELFLEGRSVSAKHDSAWEQARKFVRRNKGLSAGLATALVVLLVSLAFVAKAWHDTGTAYAAYQDQVKKSVPAFVEAARLAAEQRLYDNAMRQVDVAIASDDTYPDAHLLKAQLLVARQDFTGARSALVRYLQLEPSDSHAKRLLELCQDAKQDDVGRLLPIATVLSEQQAYALVDGLLSKYGKNSNEARQFLLTMYRAQIEKAWPGKANLLTIDASGLRLNFVNIAEVTDLSPLKGMPLTLLECSGTQVSDLSPLKGMPLTVLGCGYSRVSDLSPLKGMPLTALSCDHSHVSNLSPLKGMQLLRLYLYGTKVTDLTPLVGMTLTTFSCNLTRVADLSPLKGMPLTELNCSQTPVADLSPLKGMPLTRLEFFSTNVSDLSPLAGMRLSSLNVGGTKVTDLAPVVGMPLTTFSCNATKVADLSPLKGMALTEVHCYESSVTDLSPLAGMRLTYLDIFNTGVSDLSPLAGMRLAGLRCDGSAVKDLSPLRGMPITSLSIHSTSVTDLTPLEGMPLSYLALTPSRIKQGIESVRATKSLKIIALGGAATSNMPPEEFWKKYDAGEFHAKEKKP